MPCMSSQVQEYTLAHFLYWILSTKLFLLRLYTACTPEQLPSRCLVSSDFPNKQEEPINHTPRRITPADHSYLILYHPYHIY